MTLHHGDCLEVLPTLDAESIDAIVTDPPYLLSFMGKAWDSVPVMSGHAQPDADTVGFYQAVGKGGTHDRGVANFEPKRMQAWHEAWAREAFRVAKPGAHLLAFGGTRTYHRLASAIEDAGWEIRDTLVWCYATGFPKSLNLPGGLGTALKPAFEPIVLARKPLRGTVAANVQAYGTGALNIDGCRIGIPEGDGLREWGDQYGGDRNKDDGTPYARTKLYGNGDGIPGMTGTVHAAGRWPANVILTDPIFDGDTPGVVGGEPEWSRFFAITKADRDDREPVLGRSPDARVNGHPTVKSTDLMRHLVRLVTPPGGLVLDPFMGSGTTALACEMEGFRWVGIEREAEYVAIAEARLNGTQRGLGLVG